MRPLIALLLLAGCTGDIKVPIPGVPGPRAPTGPTDPKNPVDPMQPEAPPAPALVELRRLSRAELDATLAELTRDTSHVALNQMPGEELTPFDNAYEGQQASAVWVEAAERLAEKITADTLASPTRKASILPCTPANADDLACLEAFTRSFGRRVLRRPLDAAEVAELTDGHALARQRGGFDASLSLVMRRLLLDPEFLFRVEVGQSTSVAGQYQLGPYELAARLSFFLQGRGPTEALLDLAESGGLDTPDKVRVAAAGLLDAPEGRTHFELFHAMWLGYLSLPHDAAFNTRAVTESTALVKKVVFEDRADYRQLFTSTQTWADDALAMHYGLPVSGTAGFRWVDYGTSGRKGILSHASVLSNGVKQTDTSPTLRGKWIRNRLFCQEIPPPPPNVTADVPPPQTGAAVCKKDRYAAHDSVQSCAACHLQMDPIGFGLEQYDRMGRFRSVEAAHPECAITGEGTLQGVGTFTGPAGLADLMVQNGTVDQCVVKQVFRFGSGRREGSADGPLLRDLTRAFTANGRQFDALLLDYVSHPTFALRQEAL